jgi:hypothetical protein
LVNGWVTFGTGGTYATAWAALLDGKVNILQAGNSTEPTWTFNSLPVIATTTALKIYGSSLHTITFNSTIDFGGSQYRPEFWNCNVVESGIGAAGVLFNAGAGTRGFGFYYSKLTMTSASITNNDRPNKDFVGSTIQLANLDDPVNGIKNFTDCNVIGGGVNFTVQCGNITRTRFSGTFRVDSDRTISIGGVAPVVDGFRWEGAVSFVILSNSANTKFSNCRFNGAKLFSSVAQNYFVSNCDNVGFHHINSGKWKLNNCSLAASPTIVGAPQTMTVELDNCSSATTLTLNGNQSSVRGGDYTTILVNGNNNVVTGVIKSTAITVNAAATGNIIGLNQCDSAILPVSNNKFYGNNDY